VVCRVRTRQTTHEGRGGESAGVDVARPDGSAPEAVRGPGSCEGVHCAALAWCGALAPVVVSLDGTAWRAEGLWKVGVIGVAREEQPGALDGMRWPG
jgi:hypothetical protein